jgi:hypothetical protein
MFNKLTYKLNYFISVFFFSFQVIWGWFAKQKFTLSSTFSCDLIYTCQRYYLVTLCCVTFIRLRYSTKCTLFDLCLYSFLHFKLSEVGFVMQKFKLSSSFRWDLIYTFRWSGFNHTLLCHLSQTYMFSKLTYQFINFISVLFLLFKLSEGGGLLSKSSSLAQALGGT